ncbi:MAG: DUF6029 family protein [Bacteroidales bacterium]|nr:DUF6029 family protein [Bacteroidales bacterium]MDZ4204249.1 DUF6029 family protein [Bacteroidales bacterium]
MMRIRQILPIIILYFIGLLFLSSMASAQELSSLARINGNFQLDAQLYRPDSLIGAPKVPEKILMNTFTNLLYSQGNFTAGIRFESYLNPLLGYDPRHQGTGLSYRFITYQAGDFEVTAGNFYEQFGSGMIFRAYEDWNLGIDNSLDGVRVRFRPANGIAIKGVYGHQRYFWELSPGIVRGLDAELNINDLINSLSQSGTRILLGGSAVSKYQKDELISPQSGLRYDLPLNVAAFAGRMNITSDRLNFAGEYAYKVNDPSSVNGFIYKPGHSLLITASYFRQGLSLQLSAKHTDNMSFKSRRTEMGNALDINFLPPLTKQHSYALIARYPYATQSNGEVAYQGQLIYTIKRNTKLGGRYGTSITMSYNLVNSLNRTAINDTTPIGAKGTLGYNAKLFDSGNEKYFSEFNIEISRRINKDLKVILQYINLFYDIGVIQGHIGDPDVKAGIVVADIQYKLSNNKSLRFELQNLSTAQDLGDWFSGLAEYTIAPRWSFSIADQWNYGNTDKKLHYYNFAISYSHKSSRIAISWGRQNEGIVCVGGVCRYVPANNGLMLTLSSSF